jgi:hypothetical protein
LGTYNPVPTKKGDEYHLHEYVFSSSDFDEVPHPECNKHPSQIHAPENWPWNHGCNKTGNFLPKQVNVNTGMKQTILFFTAIRDGKALAQVGIHP